MNRCNKKTNKTLYRMLNQQRRLLLTRMPLLQHSIAFIAPTYFYLPQSLQPSCTSPKSLAKKIQTRRFYVELASGLASPVVRIRVKDKAWIARKGEVKDPSVKENCHNCRPLDPSCTSCAFMKCGERNEGEQDNQQRRQLLSEQHRKGFVLCCAESEERVCEPTGLSAELR